MLRKAKPKLKEAWRRLRGGEVTPFRAAASVGVGLIIGATPAYGFHWLLVIALCVPLRLDAPVAYLAANISLPFIAPFLAFIEITIGVWVRAGQMATPTVDSIREHGVKDFAKELAIGTAIFAPALGALGFGLTYGAVALKRRRNARADLAKASSEGATVEKGTEASNSAHE